MKFKKVTLIIGLLLNPTVYARTYDLPYNMQFDVSGYAGWRQIFSSARHDSIPSQPELGLLANLKLTDNLTIFNQFKYGTTINDILVYNQINYTPNIPIQDFEITLKGGKIRYDNFLYNNTRVNPRTRQGVFQPQAIYWYPFAQTLTSGTGIGFDSKYKNFNISYVITNPTVVNADKEAKAWTRQSKGTNFNSNFGGFQLANIGYEIPDYGIKTKLFWQRNNFSFDVINGPQNIGLSLDYIGGGIEWKYNNLTLSSEGFCLQRSSLFWHTGFSGLTCAISPTIEYDITENISIRTNYNQYRSPETPGRTTQNRVPDAQLQTYSKDVNVGIGWHKGQWLMNIQADYVQGGRLVDPYNFIENPTNYKQFWIVGTNLVYFFN